jgi:hypothetical protein
MNMPGFTAESSIGRARRFRGRWAQAAAAMQCSRPFTVIRSASMTVMDCSDCDDHPPRQAGRIPCLLSRPQSWVSARVLPLSQAKRNRQSAGASEPPHTASSLARRVEALAREVAARLVSAT